MPRRRRADDDEDDEEYGSNDSPAQTQRATQRRRSASPGSEDEDQQASANTQTFNSSNLMVKRLVRLALASEYSRQPIRRADISTKVLGDGGSRRFKLVFHDAQKILREVFGMQMVEQPSKEKVTISQRRAAQRAEKSSTTKSWTLVSTLPAAYRIPAILQPPKAPSAATESSYVAIYTFIISLIMLAGGSISEDRLGRYLRRVNAETYTPIEKTEKLLARLCKEGYLVKVRDSDTGEEVIEYLVGPRGKVEVGVVGVSGLARKVYGVESRESGGEVDEKFEERLERSLGITKKPEVEADGEEGEERQNGGDSDA